MIYCVCVAPNHRKKVCVDGWIWVKDAAHEFYVTKKERGEFATREEAQAVITEPFEIIVSESGRVCGDAQNQH